MAKKKATRKAPVVSTLDTYWDRTQWPLQSLYFLLPLLVIYEAGIVMVTRGEERLRAERMLGLFFETFGVASLYLPAVIVVAVLLSWHLLRRDPWRPEPKLYALMWVEAAVLALPLFVFVLTLFRQAPLAAAFESVGPIASPLVTSPPVHTWQENLLFSVGAGIYEELLFRIIAIAVLHMLLVDLLALPDSVGAIGSVFGSAIAFALYHFPPFWDGTAFSEAFHAPRFAFYTFAGIYLAAVYVLRGFGIVAATHALYDVLVVMEPWLRDR